MLHRDLKPSNILLDAQGEPQLTDFGLVKFIQKESTLTHTNAVLGTPAYMSPEQARGNTKAVTTTADVYGLGAVLYETLAGTPPFGGGTSLETIRQVLDEEPRRPSIFNSEVELGPRANHPGLIWARQTQRGAPRMGMALSLAENPK